MDISNTLQPTSDQLDAIDLLHTGPQVFTITEVISGNAEQPVQIRLAEFPRVWRPGKSMRRVLAYCWGVDASVWVGRKVKLYCDETVTFGKDVTGGTRISELSHIDKVQKVPLLVTRGKSATFTVQPLKDAAPTPSPAPTVGPETERAIADLTAEWHDATDERKAEIQTEVARLRGES